MNLPDVMSPEDVDALLSEPDVSSWIGRRDRLLLLLMVRCGLRVSEACGLQRDQVSVGDDAVWLRLRNVKRTVGKASKRGRFRNVPCPPDVADAVREWIENDLSKDAVFLLPSERAARLDRSAAYRRVRKYADAACEADRVWPHLLRHTAVTEMLEAGFDLYEAAAIAGHSSIAVTGIYAHVRNEKIEGKMKAWKR